MKTEITLTTTDGDMVDEICQRHYGKTSGMVELVIAANPHLLAYPPRLPAGLSITLPAVDTAPERHTRLWAEAPPVTTVVETGVIDGGNVDDPTGDSEIVDGGTL